MDILIKNMEITDRPITLVLYPNGDVDHLTQDNRYETIAKAIEIPPHGRLGDLDELFKKVKENPLFLHRFEQNRALRIISDTPTIVEASNE